MRHWLASDPDWPTHEWNNDRLCVELPEVIVSHRMILDKAWWRALDAVLVLAALNPCKRCRRVAVMHHLDTLDPPISGLERRTISSYALDENEA